MNKTATITWVLLIALTIASALCSSLHTTYVAIIILIIAALKFVGITFQFMEIKKANPFWKGMILGFLILFTTIILALK